MEKILYEYIKPNKSYEDFKKELIIDHQGVFYYDKLYYYIIPLKEVSEFYSKFRKGCESEIKSHIPEQYHIYINYNKFYSDCLYNSYEYDFLSSMNIIDTKYKIGIYNNVPNIPKL